jgi:hypothetical protein
MKYELDPDNRNCADDVLLHDLRAVAQRLGKPFLTRDDYNAHGRFCAATMRKRFGSWNKALEIGGLPIGSPKDIPHEELLHDLKRVAGILGTGTVSQASYRSLGKFSEVTVARAFGSWVEALEVAGLNISSAWKPKAKEEELFSNMAAVWENVGRQPKQRDFRSPTSRFSPDAYVRRYGSWRKALEAFVAAANAGDVPSEVSNDFKLSPTPTPDQKPRRTTREPGWRLRFLVMRRDRFSCSACGRTPALGPGVILDVDHIEAWSKGGETVMDNLQTLCQRCNIGKSDLPMNEEDKC